MTPPHLPKSNRRKHHGTGQDVIIPTYCACFCELACLGRDRGEASSVQPKRKAKAAKSSVLEGVSQSIRNPKLQDQSRICMPTVSC